MRFFSIFLLACAVLSAQTNAGSWLSRKLSGGFGRLRMSDASFTGRFGGGAWGSLNGADFDADGDIDLAITFGAGGGAKGTFSGLFVYENIGSAASGILDSGEQLTIHAAIQAATPFVGDANADSKPDIFCNGWLFLNESLPGKIRFSAPRAANDPDWPDPGECDWNGDGVPDLFVADRWQLRWANGQTGETAALTVGGYDLLTDVFIRPFACDWDGDGDRDILVGQESGHITWIENQGGQLLAEVHLLQKNPLIHSGCASVPVLCDWDGDGDIDLITGNAAGFFELFEMNDGNFEPVQRLQAGGKQIRILAGELGSIQGPGEARWGYTCPEVADWDLDGDLDLLAGCVTGENLCFENIGSRTSPRLASATRLTIDWGSIKPVFPEGIRYTPSPGALVTQTRCRPQVIDWNRDGLPDYVTIDEKGTLAVYPRFRRPNGTLGLRPAEYPFCDQSGSPLRFCSHPNPGRNGRIKFSFADWDGDGDLDIIRGAGREDGTLNLDNQGNFTYLECLRTDNGGKSLYAWRGELVRSELIRLQGHTSSPVILDIDANGTLDILTGCEDGNIYWFLREWIEAP